MKWAIYKVAAKQIWLGEIEATDEAEAIQGAGHEADGAVAAAQGGQAA